jgi:dephospho-CoA kinase
VERPEDCRPVPYDPSWAGVAARLVGRVAAAAGDLGRGVEHIGSTAVPGLAAKPVIDLQLAVDDLAAADALADQLADAGFPRSAGNVQDGVHPVLDPDPAAWQKRFHGGADPAVLVHLHVRERGGPGWRTALVLRDWWRADAEARDRYQALKLAVAASAGTATGYAAAKEPLLDDLVAQALNWARRTGWAPEG